MYFFLVYIFEFVFEYVVFWWGFIFGYGNLKIFFDVLVCNCNGDICEFKFSVLIGVFVVWEIVKKGIIGKVNVGSFVVCNFFWGVFGFKEKLMYVGFFGSGFLDVVVFKKIKEVIGGCFRLCFSVGGFVFKEI